MKRLLEFSRLSTILLLTALVVPAELAGEGDGAVLVAEPSPGDRGVVLTAIQGEEIDEIPLTYLGVQKDLIGPGYDVHLVQLEGPIADRIGVAAGMSGSPVYFDGKLLGALAYRFGVLPGEPVAGVTPIQDILRADRGRGGAPAATPSLVAPIGTPVQLSGLAGPVRDWVAPQFEELGFVLVAGGGADEATGEPPELRPGSPVGVELVRGDMSIAATGTVTYVDGETVYAFGHPFLGSGAVEMPMVSVAVVHTLADLAGSVKMTRVGDEVGSILEDRLTAVVGRSGRQARMIPLEVAVDGADYGSQTFHFEVARSTTLSPLLAAVAVANALSANVGHGQEATMLSSGTIRIKGLPELPVEIAATSGSGSDPAIGVAVMLQTMLGSLWVNPFADVELESVELSVRVDPNVRRYRVEQLQYDRGPLRPGETLTVSCVLRRFRGGTVTRSFDLELPEDLAPDAKLSLAVGPPEHVDRALGQPLARRLRSAGDINSVIGVLADIRASHRLTAVLYEQAQGVVSRGVEYPDLPPSAQRLLSARARTDKTSVIRAADVARGEVELDGPIEGGVVVRLQVNSDLEPRNGERDR